MTYLNRLVDDFRGSDTHPRRTRDLHVMKTSYTLLWKRSEMASGGQSTVAK
jgi:hypothetical protein